MTRARYTNLTDAELREERERLSAELEHRHLDEVLTHPAQVELLSDHLKALERYWYEGYMGSITEVEEATDAVRWLWAGTVIAHESQYERAPSVRHVVEAICTHLAELVLGGGGECAPPEPDDAEEPKFGGPWCTCRLSDDGNPESGPHLSIELDEECLLHKHLLCEEVAS